MLCDKYKELTVEERIRLIGSVCHCIQNDDTFFELACRAIEKAQNNGVLQGIEILPAPTQYELDDKKQLEETVNY